MEGREAMFNITTALKIAELVYQGASWIAGKVKRNEVKKAAEAPDHPLSHADAERQAEAGRNAGHEAAPITVRLGRK